MNRIVSALHGLSGALLLFSLFVPGWAVAQSARETAALADIATMRDAEIVVQLDTGYYTSLENLDDIPGTEIIQPWNGIDDQGGAWMLDPGTGRWYPSRLLLNRSPQLWQGPYVSYQNTAGADGAGYDPYTPIDPWGNPYLLFSPLGLARPTGPDITLEYYGDQFDQWYIVSLGSDGVMSSDDLGMAFGTAPTALVISSVHVLSTSSGSTASSAVDGSAARVALSAGAPSSAKLSSTVQSIPAVWSVSVKGYNFGASQGTSSILLDGTALTDAATSWTSNLILQPLPANLVPGTHTLAVKTGSIVSNSLSFVFAGSLTAVKGWAWELYE